MNRLLPLLLLVTLAAGAQEPPVAERHPTTRTLHGDTQRDDYAWLKDGKDPRVLKYLEAENAYTEKVMAPFKPLIEELNREMVARIEEDDSSVPLRQRGYWYWRKVSKGQQYPVYMRRADRPGAPDEVLLDGNQLSKGHGFWGLDNYETSDDQRLLAWTTDFTGFRQHVLQVKDLTTGKLLPLKREKVTSFAWGGDNRTLFYVVEDPAKRPYRLYRASLDGGPDVLVYEEKDGRFNLDVSRSGSHRFLFLDSHSQTTSETRWLDAERPGASFRLLEPRKPNVEYTVDHSGARLYFRINDTGRNYRLVSAPVSNPGRDHWTELVPARKDVMLEGVTAFQDYLVRSERSMALPEIIVTDLKTGESREVTYPESVYEATVGGAQDFPSNQLRYSYTSLVSPTSTFDYDMSAGTSTLRKEQKVHGYDKKLYTTERVWATAIDGTQIPLSLVYRTRTGALHLSGYGAYGIPWDVDFRSERLSLLDRGVTLAYAHIRGGGDLGKPWHDAGRMENKMNTFTDFIACAEHLLATGYGVKEKLVIEGTSAGGLLMGAVANLRPDLFRAVILRVPFLDVLTTMLDESIPLTVSEFEEWGNPKRAAEYARMKDYDPVVNIAALDYPAMLVKTSLHDSQVLFHEPTKYVAKMRATRTDKHPLLLRCNMKGGHGGFSGRYDRFRDTAFEYAFTLWQMGLASATTPAAPAATAPAGSPAASR